MDIFLFAVASFLFGFTTDFADLLDEHGLKWFKFSDITFGVLWGLFGVYIIFTSVSAGLFVIALVLYWLYRGKLDYPNHALAGVMIFLSAFLFFSNNKISLAYVLIPFVALVFSWKLGVYVKLNHKSWGNLKIVILIRHFIAPLFLSILLNSFYPVYFFTFSIIGSMFSDRWFESFVKKGHSRVAQNLGMSLKEGAPV